MAFDINNYSKSINSHKAHAINATEHTYGHAIDSLATILTAGYFNTIRHHCTVGDRFMITSFATTGGGQTFAKVSTITSTTVTLVDGTDI